MTIINRFLPVVTILVVVTWKVCDYTEESHREQSIIIVILVLQARSARAIPEEVGKVTNLKEVS